MELDLGRSAGRAVAVLLAGAILSTAAVAPGAAAQAPRPAKRTSALGHITALRPLRITVHAGRRDLSCRLGPLRPQKLGYVAGARVEITCAGGLLVRIAGAKGSVSVSSSVSSSSAQSSTSGSSGSSSTASATASANGESAFDFVGPVSAAGAATISFGSYDCRLGPGSPDIGSFHAGDRVHAHCTNGVLTSIAAA